MPTKTHYIDGDNYQLRQIIFANTPKAIQQCKSIAKKFKGSTELQTCKNIFDFLKNDITYVADGGHQKVKLPSALLREKVGDCKSYSLFTGAILSNLGIGWKYVLVSYRDDPTPTHIYVVTDSGIIIDAVWGIFNSEKVPTHKYYHKPIDMRISTISGIGGYASKSKKANIGNMQTIGGAFDWYKANKGKEPSVGTKVEWNAKAVALSLPRMFLLQIFKQNGGGLSTMLNNLVFKTQPTFYTIPQAEKNKLESEVEALRVRLGVPKLTDAQKKSIFDSSVTLDSGSSSGSFSFDIDPSKLTDFAKQQAQSTEAKYEAIFGKGSYAKYLEVAKVRADKEKKLKDKYTVYPSQKAQEKWKGFENTWFWKGGDPSDLVSAVKEGATKSPKGKDFNYVIRIGMTRGIKPKDFGLIIRAITGVAFGSTFSLDSSDSFVMSKGKGNIGAVDWTAVATSIGEIASILTALFGLFQMFFPSEGGAGETPEPSNELENKLANGWLTKSDATMLNAPTPYLEEANVDGVEIVRVDPSWLNKLSGGGSSFAGFGQIALPLLIGGAVIIALNTGSKLKK